MKQFTIKGFKGLLQEDKYYKSLTRDSSRMLYYDKCNWFVSETYRTTLANEDEASLFQNLHSTNLKKVLGDRYYKHIINTLDSLGLVMINDKYSSTNFSKSYAISDRAIEIGIKKVEIQSYRFKKTYSNYLQKDYAETIKIDVFKKIIENITKLYVVNNPANYLAKILPKTSTPKPISNSDLLNLWFEETNMLKFNRYSAYFDSFKELNNHSDPLEVYKPPVFFKPKRAESGRIYHLGASVPKYIRECFVTKKKEIIYEVDMASAQPSILFLEWMRSLSSKGALKPAENAEYELCRGLFLEGGIYAYIRDNSNYYSQFKSEEKYGELKEQILTSLNGKNDKAPFVVALKELFPHFMKWVIDIKEKEGHKRVSHIGQSAEANIFVEVYKRLPDDIFSLIIHDCILTTKENTRLVRRLLVERLRELYKDIIPPNESLEKVFKIEKVSHEYTIKAKG
jgi:hypothetical protein